MKSPLIPITVPSIYEVGGVKVALPKRMAQCTPDMKLALFNTARDLKAAGGGWSCPTCSGRTTCSSGRTWTGNRGRKRHSARHRAAAFTKADVQSTSISAR